MSASEILNEMLDNLDASYQKTIGFPTYDLLAAVSLRMAGTEDEIAAAKLRMDPENLSGTDLTSTFIHAADWSGRPRLLLMVN